MDVAETACNTMHEELLVAPNAPRLNVVPCEADLDHSLFGYFNLKRFTLQLCIRDVLVSGHCAWNGVELAGQTPCGVLLGAGPERRW